MPRSVSSSPTSLQAVAQVLSDGERDHLRRDRKPAKTEVVRRVVTGSVSGHLRSTNATVPFDRLLIVNEHHLRRVLTEYLQHCNIGRPHRAVGQPAPAQAGTRSPEINLAEYQVRRRQILRGLTSEYQIAA